MAHLTIQVLEGLERGKVFHKLPTPVSIGREDENSIRLNDERVSRYHAKIQDDGQRLILTDLDSTNGTRVNGHPVHQHVLRVGDQLLIGRCLLVYGSREEIQRQQMNLSPRTPLPPPDDQTMYTPDSDEFFLPEGIQEWTSGGQVGPPPDWEAQDLFRTPPTLPEDLSPGQRAEISDVLHYLHERIQKILEVARSNSNPDPQQLPTMQVDWNRWQSLLGIEMDLATYLKRIAEP